MTPAWINALERLVREGSVPVTAIATGIRSDLESWGERTGALRRVGKGRGAVLQVASQAILQNALSQVRPLETVPDGPARSMNLARFRDTKTGTSGLESRYVLAKAVGKGTVARRANGTLLELGTWSAALGCLALELGETPEPWFCGAPLVLVENQAVFDRLGWLGPSWEGLVVYYQGNLSRRLVDWLESSQFLSVTLFPDFDGVGLRNFAFLKESVPQALWHWPAGWEAALETFGNSGLWAKGDQRKTFEAQWDAWQKNGWPDPTLRDLMERMRRGGVMLEQEWVLVG